jgi:hypothetical protein
MTNKKGAAFAAPFLFLEDETVAAERTSATMPFR